MGWDLEVPFFMDSTVFKQYFYRSFLWKGGGGCTTGCFLSCLISYMLDLSSMITNYRSFLNSLLYLVRPCGDAVHICKSCSSKVKKYKVNCHVVAFKLLGEWSLRELRSLQTRIQAISYRQFLLLERFYSRIIEQICQSHDQQLYFRKSNLKQNVDCNVCCKLQKIFQVPKIIFKAGF